MRKRWKVLLAGLGGLAGAIVLGGVTIEQLRYRNFCKEMEEAECGEDFIAYPHETEHGKQDIYYQILAREDGHLTLQRFTNPPPGSESEESMEQAFKTLYQAGARLVEKDSLEAVEFLGIMPIRQVVD